ncbi:hypothetical protein TRIATDRAFT_322671, partial [Trichoderma atroviride IMI 206040]
MAFTVILIPVRILSHQAPARGRSGGAQTLCRAGVSHAAIHIMPAMGPAAVLAPPVPPVSASGE